MNKLDLFSSRGRLLLRVMEKPGTTVKGLTKDLFLTRRSIWGMVGELRGMGYLVIRKDGRTHHYYVSAYGLAELRKLTESGHGSSP